MLLLSRYVFFQVQYEFRLFALEVFVIGPGFYFLYIAPYWDEVVEYSKILTKQKNGKYLIINNENHVKVQNRLEW